MTFSNFVEIVEILMTTFGAVGVGLALYLFRSERRDRALTIGENGRTGVLSWALVFNEALRVLAMVALLVAGLVSLLIPNQTAPASPISPLIPVLLVLFGMLSVAQSVVLIYARQRIARYPYAGSSGLAAQQDTLLEVQQDVGEVADKVGGVEAKIAGLVQRANVSEVRADDAEVRADDAEAREGNVP